MHCSRCLPGGSDGKESACNAGDPGSIPELGRSPGEWKWQPTPEFLPGKIPRTEGPGWATVRGVAKSWTGLKRLSMHARGLLCVYTVTCVLLCKELCPQSLVPGPFTCYSGVTLTTGEGSSRVADANTCTHGAWGQRRLRLGVCLGPGGRRRGVSARLRSPHSWPSPPSTTRSSAAWCAAGTSTSTSTACRPPSTGRWRAFSTGPAWTPSWPTCSAGRSARRTASR